MVPALVPHDGIELPPPGDVSVRSRGGGGDDCQERGQSRRRRRAATPRVHMIHTRSHPRGRAAELSASGRSAVGRGCWITSSFCRRPTCVAPKPIPANLTRHAKPHACGVSSGVGGAGFRPREYTYGHRRETTPYEVSCYETGE